MSKVSRLLGDAVLKRTLVLHMDINRTIIQTDPAGGKTLDDVLNSNVASRVFGGNVNGDFEPSEGRFESVETAHGGMSYADYVDEVVKIPDSMQSGTAAEKRAAWKEVSASRRQLLHSFTSSGSVGSAFSDKVEEQRAALAETLDRGYHIVPSFFRLVNQLSELEWPFMVIFRTFGNDISKVLDEWDLFLEGKHLLLAAGPILAAMRGRTRQCGALYRCEQGMAIVWNRSTPIPVASNDVDTTSMTPCEYVATVDGVRDAHNVSFHALYDELMANAKQGGGVLGLIDYYYYWSQHAEHRSAGKVFPVDETPNAPFQIFFDDNIFIGDPSSIVDLRDAITGEPMSLDKENEFCCHVLPYFAITDENYFWKETLSRITAQMSVA
ncbi:Hypothetical protein, putative [Bodo saltans]|uniref:Uncharacterized protein n=1 Tax=Bodo saltans TaxID=75058 RepID=A0A0S4JGX9_BODSA|nr:Hypothetical protein, putative [Bodo saltans]|eukprot:CUG89444.1 Hypothetical protein, putative [Bodo saltans]